MENSENKNNKKNNKIYIIGGIIIGLLLASTATLSALYATKNTCNNAASSLTKEPAATYYSVIYSANNATIYTELVEEGHDVANVPTVPTKAGYTGVWSEEGKNITKDTVIYAVYSAQNYMLCVSTIKVDCVTTAPSHMTNADVVPLVFAPQSSLYALPETVTVTGASYTWDKAAGLLTLSNASADVHVDVIGINAPQELNIHYLQYPGDDSYVQVNSGEKIYFPSPDDEPVVTTVYSNALPGDTVAMHSTNACIISVKKTSIVSGEATEIYSSGWDIVNDYSFTTEFGYKYYLEFGWQSA